MATDPILNSQQYTTLADQIGAFIEYWGFKQVHGKIWTLIFLSPQPVDANFLKENLKISKALTSMSLKDLLQYDVIKEVAKEKPGTQKYSINSNITEVILTIIKNREMKMLSDIQVSCLVLENLVGKKYEGLIDPKRMESLSAMVNTSNILLKGMADGTCVDFQMFDEVMSIQE